MAAPPAASPTAAAAVGGPPARRVARPLTQRRSRFGADAVMSGVVRCSAWGILLMLVSLVVVLSIAAYPSVKTFGWRFLVSSDWRPNALEGEPVKGPDGGVVIEDGEVVKTIIPPSFGALPVIYGTAVSSVIALILAVPLSFGAAIFLVRIAPRWLAAPASFLIEFLAAIPSIAYGLWGLFVLVPLLQAHVEPAIKSVLIHIPGLSWMFYETVIASGQSEVHELSLAGRDMLCGGIVLGIMVLPIITAIARDVLSSVPRIQIEGTLALGATWWQSSREMLRYSRSGLFGAVMLGLARAAGETMAVTMVIGNNSQIRASIFAPAQTMSSLLANEFAEASTTIHRSALAEVALILLIMSLIFNVVARWLVVGSGSRTSAAH